VSDRDPNASFAHLVRAVIAIVLTVFLPVVLYVKTPLNTTIVQVYLDAMAAVVAFYFGASTTEN
jgi:hypothetical protein